MGRKRTGTGTKARKGKVPIKAPRSRTSATVPTASIRTSSSSTTITTSATTSMAHRSRAKPERFKIINDTVHGSIKVDGVLLDLMETAEFQRLHHIHQLGLAYLVFPGANHTRLEHCLGTCHVADRMAMALGLGREETAILRCAGLLHDIGHGPFSHTLEFLFHDSEGRDHMALTKEVITGKATMCPEMGPPGAIARILEDNGLDPKEVADLVVQPEGVDRNHTLGRYDGTVVREGPTSIDDDRWPRRYMAQCIHSAIDADQLDYLLRDSHYTGVAHGVIDLERIVQTLGISNGTLVVDKSGVSAVEGMLVARSLMYSSVYFHKTVRIAEVMLMRAVERTNDLTGIDIMTDGQLLSSLKARGGLPARIVHMLWYRQLYKLLMSVPSSDLGKDGIRALVRLEGVDARRAAEEDVAARAGLEDGDVFIDVPKAELLVAEPRLTQTGIMVRHRDRLHNLDKLTPLAKALTKRAVPDWALMITTRKEFRSGSEAQRIEKAVRHVVFG